MCLRGIWNERMPECWNMVSITAFTFRSSHMERLYREKVYLSYRSLFRGVKFNLFSREVEFSYVSVSTFLKKNCLLVFETLEIFLYVISYYEIVEFERRIILDCGSQTILTLNPTTLLHFFDTIRVPRIQSNRTARIFIVY